MLPPISYKIHPKMTEIMQQKRKRRQILQEAQRKQQQQVNILREGRKEYFEQNKQQISRKLQQIHDKNILKRNLIRQEEKERAVRIAIKKAERLMKLLPQRRQLVSILQSYLQSIRNNDKIRQEKIQQIIEARLIFPVEQIKLKQKIKQNNIIDTNDGICVICLTSEAHVYMVQCRHLISCNDCKYILRMQRKCPLCRCISDHADLKDNKKCRKSTEVKKRHSLI